MIRYDTTRKLTTHETQLGFVSIDSEFAGSLLVSSVSATRTLIAVLIPVSRH